MLTRMLRKLVNEDQYNWDIQVPTVVFAYNISKHSTIFSPFKMLYGYEPAMPAVIYPLIAMHSFNNNQDYVTRLTQ